MKNSTEELKTNPNANRVDILNPIIWMIWGGITRMICSCETAKGKIYHKLQ
jgi:hypothetical protein